MTWLELREYARSSFKLSRDDERSFSLSFQFDTRAQLISVRTFRAFEEEWIEYRSNVCREEAMSPKVALKKNLEIAVGALGLEEGRYVLSYSLPVASLSFSDFERPLSILARIADTLERDYTAEDTF